MPDRRDNQLPLQTREKGQELMLYRRDNQKPLQTRGRFKSGCLIEETINYRYRREGGSEVDAW